VHGEIIVMMSFNSSSDHELSERRPFLDMSKTTVVGNHYETFNVFNFYCLSLSILTTSHIIVGGTLGVLQCG